MFKRMICIALCLCAVLGSSAMVSSAQEVRTAASIEMYGYEWVQAVPQALIDRGLTLSTIKSLNNAGFTFDEIAQLSETEIYSILGPAYLGRASYARPSIKVTNVPDDISGTSTEYYVSASGFKNGTWAANGGSTIQSRLNNFAASVYKISASNVKKTYYLYGEWDSAAGYHKGVDFQAANGRAIYAHEGGQAYKRFANYGALCIAINSSRTHVYMHMRNIPFSFFSNTQTVIPGMKIGEQSNVTASGTIASHLHFEVHASNNISSLGSPSVQSAGTTVIPYNDMA